VERRPGQVRGVSPWPDPADSTFGLGTLGETRDLGRSSTVLFGGGWLLRASVVGCLATSFTGDDAARRRALWAMSWCAGCRVRAASREHVAGRQGGCLGQSIGPCGTAHSVRCPVNDTMWSRPEGCTIASATRCDEEIGDILLLQATFGRRRCAQRTRCRAPDSSCSILAVRVAGRRRQTPRTATPTSDPRSAACAATLVIHPAAWTLS